MTLDSLKCEQTDLAIVRLKCEPSDIAIDSLKCEQSDTAIVGQSIVCHGYAATSWRSYEWIIKQSSVVLVQQAISLCFYVKTFTTLDFWHTMSGYFCWDYWHTTSGCLCWTIDASDYQHLPTLQSNTTGDSLSRQYNLPNAGRNKNKKLWVLYNTARDSWLELCII